VESLCLEGLSGGGRVFLGAVLGFRSSFLVDE